MSDAEKTVALAVAAELALAECLEGALATRRLRDDLERQITLALDDYKNATREAAK